jgi:hypothetical protein
MFSVGIHYFSSCLRTDDILELQHRRRKGNDAHRLSITCSTKSPVPNGKCLRLAKDLQEAMIVLGNPLLCPLDVGNMVIQGLFD